ncbi:hypothetical protein J437_LFUL001720 [Ladona fulva]|uniref:Galactose-1-phosphate uridylyltransferase n=1 Tax=Ladona fulva TaxID=123851 RepID=A0A8K0K470_LADFU|nr:hypothetical protein J437_LFUL001720 [Ladona fulva]
MKRNTLELDLKSFRIHIRRIDVTRHLLRNFKMSRCLSIKYVTHFLLFLLGMTLLATLYQPMVVKKDEYKQSSLSIFLDNLKDQEWYRINCFDGKLYYTIEKMPLNLDLWSQAFERKCQILWSKFQKIYSVDVREGKLEFPMQFESKLQRWFYNLDPSLKEIRTQTVIHVRNKYTKEHTIYNPLRAKRPLQSSDRDPLGYVNKLSSSTRESCDFCNYETMTSKDFFDRIEGKYSVTAANAFKLDKWHGLIITREHNPANITEDVLLDMFNTTLMWFKLVNIIDKSSKFPNILWDSLPHAGASQLHPHVHVILDPMQYYGILDEQLSAASEYYEKTGNNYWEDIIEIHHALGLAKIFGNSVAMTPLTSRKDNEVILLSNSPSVDFFRLLYFVIRTYYEQFRIYCFSSGMALPVIDGSVANNLPAFIRIATRGDCSGAYNVNVDLYWVISNLTKIVYKLSADTTFQSKTLVPWISQ